MDMDKAKAWGIIIAAVGTVLIQVANGYFDSVREYRKINADRETKTAIIQVVEGQEKTHANQDEFHEVLKTAAAKVEDIKADTKELVNNNSPVGIIDSDGKYKQTDGPPVRIKPLEE